MSESHKDKLVSTIREDGVCSICQKHYERLSADHIWPKAAFGKRQYEILQYPLPDSNEDAKRVKAHSGITFRAICEECNNKLGSLYDKALIDFTETIKVLASTQLALPAYPSIQSYPTAIIKSVFGHMLATKTTEYQSELDEAMRLFLFDETAILSDDIRLYYWYYPYDVPVVAMNRTAYDSGATCLFSVMKLYPLAFLAIYKNKMTDTRFVELTQYNKNDITQKCNIPLRLFDVEQDFPEGSRFSKCTLVINDSTRFIAFPKEQSNNSQ